MGPTKVMVVVISFATLLSKVDGNASRDKYLEDLCNKVTDSFKMLDNALPNTIAKETDGIVNLYMYTLRLVIVLFDDCIIPLHGDVGGMTLAKDSLQSIIDDTVNDLKPLLDSKRHEGLLGIIKKYLRVTASSIVEIFKSMATAAGDVTGCSTKISNNIVRTILRTKKDVEDLLKA